MFTDASGQPVHPHAVSQAFDRIVRRADIPIICLHELRHTHGTLLIEAGVPVKVVSERLGHASPTFTIETYQHVLPGMQAKAATTFEKLIAPEDVPPATRSTGQRRRNTRRKADLTPEERPTTTNAQVADLGIHPSGGGGGRI